MGWACDVVEAGANAIVSGSGVFGAKDYAEGERAGLGLHQGAGRGGGSRCSGWEG